MLLQEFDLDLPYIANIDIVNQLIDEKKLTHAEATQYDYKTNWKEKRRNFRLETRCITAMFERLFEKFETDNCWKVMVECVSQRENTKVINLSGVVTVQIMFDYESFSKADEQEKKRIACTSLMEGIKLISQSLNWEMDTFEAIKEKIYDLDFINEWYWKKPVKNPKKLLSASILCIHNTKSMDIHLIVKDKKGNLIANQLIISELPDEFAYAKHLGKLKWTSDSEVVLINKKNDRNWSVTIQE